MNVHFWVNCAFYRLHVRKERSIYQCVERNDVHKIQMLESVNWNSFQELFHTPFNGSEQTLFEEYYY